MKTLPKKIIRVDDGAEFILDDNNKYKIKITPYLYGTSSYTYETLMEIHKGTFKIADGTEDLKKMREKWFNDLTKEMKKNCGCGDDE